jgi:hypothetical protein
MLRKRSASKKQSSDWSLRTILLESFFIVMALLLALWLNDWNNERNNQKLVDQILESARQEISDNLALLEESIEFRSELLPQIRSGRREMQRIPNFRALSGVDFHDRDAMSRFLNNMFISEGLFVLAGSELHETEDGAYWMRFFDSAIRLEMDGDDLVAYGSGNIQLMPAYLSSVVWNTATAANALIHMDYGQLMTLSDIYSTQQNYSDLVQQTINLLYSGTNVVSAIEDMYYFELELRTKYKAFLGMD